MQEIFSSPDCLDWCWGPCSLLFKKYWGIFSQVQGSRGVKLAACPPKRSALFENSRHYTSTLRQAWFACAWTTLLSFEDVNFNTANNLYGLVKNTRNLKYYQYWYCTISNRQGTVLRKPRTSLANRLSRSVEKQ